MRFKKSSFIQNTYRSPSTPSGAAASTNEEGGEDLGFGSKINSGGQRLINSDGSFNIERRGVRYWAPYQSSVEMSWPQFLGMILLAFIGINALFAIIFQIIGVHSLHGVDHQGVLENFANCFFFSVQTFTTVGYGAISPGGLPANIVASLCALVGLISFAIATGLFFARFSKPVANIKFSKHALIADYQGGKSFQFRIANKRDAKILDLEAKVTMAWTERLEDGGIRRRFAGLELERDQVYMFPLNWTIVHPIDENSPLNGKTKADLEFLNVEFIILIEGHHETYAQQVQRVYSYFWNEVIWDANFQPMYFPGDNGKTILQLDWIDAIDQRIK